MSSSANWRAIPVVSGNKIARGRLHYLAVKPYAIVISAISTYYIDAIIPSPLRGDDTG
jgi:hypothetical protein